MCINFGYKLRLKEHAQRLCRPPTAMHILVSLSWYKQTSYRDLGSTFL